MSPQSVPCNPAPNPSALRFAYTQMQVSPADHALLPHRHPLLANEPSPSPQLTCTPQGRFFRPPSSHRKHTTFAFHRQEEIPLQLLLTASLVCGLLHVFLSMYSFLFCSTQRAPTVQPWGRSDNNGAFSTHVPSPSAGCWSGPALLGVKPRPLSGQRDYSNATGGGSSSASVPSRRPRGGRGRSPPRPRPRHPCGRPSASGSRRARVPRPPGSERGARRYRRS